MTEIKKVCLIGLGALGIMYAEKLSALLPEGDFSVIVDKERRERYEKQGIFCNGRTCSFHYVLPEEAKPCDLLIFSTKATGLHAAMESAKGFVGENTIILSVINGIVSEQILGEAFGAEKMIYAVAQGTDATRVGNRLTYHVIGDIVIGEENGEISERIRAVEKLLRDAGIGCQVRTDILRHQWNKFMYNVGLNQVTTVFETDYSGVQQSGEARDTMIAAMNEVRGLSEYEGIDLTEEDIAGWLKILDTFSPDGEPSMRQDAKAKRPTEVFLFAQTVQAFGKKHGVPTPVNDWLEKKIMEIEASY